MPAKRRNARIASPRAQQMKDAALRDVQHKQRESARGVETRAVPSPTDRKVMKTKIDYTDVLREAGVTPTIADENGPDGLTLLRPVFRAVDDYNAGFKMMAAAPGGGGIDWTQIITALIPLLGGVVQNLLNRPPKPTPPPEVPESPKPPAPPEDEEPADLPGIPTPKPVRTIKSFKGKYHQIIHEGRTVDAQHFKALLSREAPVREGDRIVADYSPLDQRGVEIRDGEWTEELRAAMFFSDGSHRIRYYGNNPEITHITMNHELGLMPRVKVDRNVLDNDEEAETGSLFGLYYTDGEAPMDDDPDFNRPHIRLPDLPSLRVKG